MSQRAMLFGEASSAPAALPLGGSDLNAESHRDLFSFSDTADADGPLADAENALLGVQSGGTYWLVDARSVCVDPLPRLTRVPLTPHWLRGLACLEGALVGVIDLAALQGGALTPITHDSRLLRLPLSRGRGALLVGSVVGERSLADLSPVPNLAEGRPYLGERYRDSRGRIWQALDLARLANLPEFKDCCP